MPTVRYNFDWDPAKAEGSASKHGVSFDRAATVFRDPNALSLFDGEHSEDEERWLTLGIDSKRCALGRAPHTFTNVDKENCSVRIISARKATKTETKQYKTKA
jgi:uncharacterized protein